MGRAAALFSEVRFRRLWIASAVSMLGTQISRVALVLHVFHTTDDVRGQVLLTLCPLVPTLLVSPLAGVVVDRKGRRALLVGADLFRFATTGLAAMAPTIGAVYAMVTLNSIAGTFGGPARVAALQRIVAPSELERANSVDQTMSNAAWIIGPVIGAELYLHLGIVATLALDALSFLASALVLYSIDALDEEGRADHRPGPAPSTERQARMTDDVLRGLSYVTAHPLAWVVILLGFISLVSAGLWAPLAPFFVREFLGGTDRDLALQLSAFGIGGLLGALGAPAVADYLGTGRALLAAWVAEATTMCAYAFVPHRFASAAMMLVWGAVISCVVVPYYTILQRVIAPEFLGRTVAMTKQVESIALLFAMLIALAARGLLSADRLLALAGSVYLLLVMMAATLPAGRRLWCTP